MAVKRKKMHDFSSNMAVQRKNACFFIKYGCQAKKCKIFRKIWLSRGPQHRTDRTGKTERTDNRKTGPTEPRTTL